MATPRTTTDRRFPRLGRRSLIAALVGAGAVLTPLAAAPAMAAEPASATSIVASGPAAQVAVNTAMAQLGKPYGWGGAGPNSFDCSGLTQFTYGAAGIGLPHFTGAQMSMGIPVSGAALQPGDLVFFYGGGHVGIYIGNGQMVHAPTSGDVVKVTNIAYMGPLSGARRIA